MGRIYVLSDELKVGRRLDIPGLELWTIAKKCVFILSDQIM